MSILVKGQKSLPITKIVLFYTVLQKFSCLTLSTLKEWTKMDVIDMLYFHVKSVSARAAEKKLQSVLCGQVQRDIK